MQLESLLERLVAEKASELLLAVGQDPRFFGPNGSSSPLSEPTSRADIDALMAAYLSTEQLATYDAQGSFLVTYRGEWGSFQLGFFRRLGQPSLQIRPLPQKSPALAELSLPPSVARLAEFSGGMVLLAGHSGSGRSTTLAALVDTVNRSRAVRISILEETIQVVHAPAQAYLSQTEVGTDVPDFAAGLRAVRLEKPEVVVLDEIRDAAVAEAALSWALGGRLVLGVLQADDVVKCLERFLALFSVGLRSQKAIELALCLKAVFCQRLVAKKEGEGRVPAAELMFLGGEVAELLRDSRLEDIGDLLRGANHAEMFSFNQSLAALVRGNHVDRQMGLALATNQDEFLNALGEKRHIERPVRWNLMSLLRLTIENGASDLHLSAGRPPILRIGGELEKLSMPRLTSRDIRNMLFGCISPKQRGDFEREKELDCSLEVDGGTRFRLNAFYQKGCVAIAFRTIPSRIPSAQELGIPEALLRLAKRPHGLILTVGPTGSGKTTTVACLVDQINRTRACHIITVEDPIEYAHDSLMATLDQREVYADTPTFRSALKYVLRQDPDVIVVGEMRDLETISAVLTAAETGHLVFATLHTNDACQTIDRIVDVFPPHQQAQIRQQVAASLLAVVSQRLLPRADEQGRVAAFELLIANQAIRSLIREGKTHQMQNVLSTSSNVGMTTLDRSLARLFQKGLVAFEEAARFVSDPQILRNPEVLAGPV